MEVGDEAVVIEDVVMAEKAVLAPMKNITPTAQPVLESVFQSGIGSVKKLLWRM